MWSGISEKAAFLVSVASAPFEHRIGGDEGLAAMRRHRLDVDHGAGDLLAPHDLRRVLHEEERRPGVDREHAVEQLGRRVEDGAAIGDRRDIDQHVDAPEGLVGLGDHLAAIVDLAEIGLDVAAS